MLGPGAIGYKREPTRARTANVRQRIAGAVLIGFSIYRYRLRAPRARREVCFGFERHPVPPSARPAAVRAGGCKQSDLHSATAGMHTRGGPATHVRAGCA